MTKQDMHNVRQLKEMLGDESRASLLDIRDVILKLSRCDESVKSFKVVAPVDVLHGYFLGRDELWGLTEPYFWTLNNKVSESDFSDYFKCIEALPDVNMACSVIHFMVWGMGKEASKEKFAAFTRQIPPFISDGKWNGSVSALLAIRSAIDCVSQEQNMQTNVVLSIIRNRMGLERTVATIAAISLVIRALAGCLEEEEGWRGNVRYTRQVQLLDLFKALKEENKKCLRDVSFSLIAPLVFSLDIERDWKATEECRNIGLTTQGRSFSYAEALSVAYESDIILSRDDCVKACTLALFSKDRSFAWKQKAFRSVATFMAALIASFDDSKAIWQDIRRNTRHLIYRGLHEYQTGATESISEQVEIFVGTAFFLVCDFCNKGRIRDAMEVWGQAWSECVTALYALTLTNGFIPLIQYLFVKAGLCFTNESELVPSGIELLGQLPCVDARPDEQIDCAEVCIKALKGNLDDAALARINAKDPNLAKLIEASAC